MVLTRRQVSTRSPFEAYLSQINETPLLNAEQEQELAYRVQGGDSEARDWMVRANLRLVVNLARGYQRQGLDLQDLIAEGNLGLMRAVEAFDPTQETRLSTYASYWIKQSMRRAIQNTAKAVRLPAYVVQLLTEWHRATARLEEELGRSPVEEEVACRMQLSAKKLKIIKKALRVQGAGQMGTSADSEQSLEELLPDDDRPTPAEALVKSDDLRQVLDLVKKMDPREATVLRLRFGLSGESPLTLKEIGDRIGLTRERVRQIEREAMAKLGESIASS
jgi:RNA polymerase primary sigma factor